MRDSPRAEAKKDAHPSKRFEHFPNFLSKYGSMILKKPIASDNSYMFLIMSCLASGKHGAPPSPWLRKHLHDRSGLNQSHNICSFRGWFPPSKNVPVFSKDPTNLSLIQPKEILATNCEDPTLWPPNGMFWRVTMDDPSYEHQKMGKSRNCIWIFDGERKFVLLHGPSPATTWDDEYIWYMNILWCLLMFKGLILPGSQHCVFLKLKNDALLLGAIRRIPLLALSGHRRHPGKNGC